MTNVMDADQVFETMKKKVPPKVLDANVKAWELGVDYAKRAMAGEKFEDVGAAC
jgi:Pyruvate/2-oxoacid:ferredoxin oxidoreductase gamma subunit